MNPGDSQDWGALLYLAAVGAVTLAMDWIRRRVMRHEDELDRKAQQHRRVGDRPSGRTRGHRRWDDAEELDG